MTRQTMFSADDRGVSPVVGVILMVAITVILAAVIGTFVLDLGSNVQQNAQAGVDISQSPDEASGTDADTSGSIVDVQIVSMDNADTVNVSSTGNIDSCDGTHPAAGKPCQLSSVGQSASVDGVASGDTVTVTAELAGKKNVIQTYEVQ